MNQKLKKREQFINQEHFSPSNLKLEEENEFLKRAIADLEKECNDLQKQADLVGKVKVVKPVILSGELIAEKNKLAAEVSELRVGENKVKEELVEATRKNQEVSL